MEPEIRDLSIYVHIPFCRAKCSYCDFLSFAGCEHSKQEQYVNALCREINAYAFLSEEYRVQTIFFGGGTPSYIDADFICRILETVRNVFDVAKDAEVTIEGNPDSLNPDKLQTYKEAGINRLSIGLQSANDDMLLRIGRIHNYNQFMAAYTSARQTGFDNINVDLMAGLPSENMDSYLRTLETVGKLQPEHISAYSLSVEEGTPLSTHEELLAMLPKEEEERQMYAETKHFLGQGGYKRYEISNYAKEGFACRHNKVYWTGGEYLGVGLGAASYLAARLENAHCGKIRFHGIENMDEYIERFMGCDGMHYQDLYFCKREDEMEEFMFLGLRLMQGVSREEFRNRFGVTMESVYGNVMERYVEKGLLIDKDGWLRLSDRGIDVSNVVMAEFML
ncbi:MAG: radical SAM family heme chaperone HemW [Clostridium sp.]|nr:radical SAM family heme chaperone HemW [Clostridium sp.]